MNSSTQPLPVPRLTDAPPGPAFIDTHAHIHFANYAGTVDQSLFSASEAGVPRVITVGVNTDDSRKAVKLASTYANVWATVGIHPHGAGEADQGMGYLRDLATHRKVVAVGECGLDFYRSETSPEEQERALRAQVELAQELELPVVFHVRDAFPKFFEIMGDYPGVAGVVHSFTAGQAELDEVLERGWYVALNGIMTFTKDEGQLEAARRVPLSRLLLETDCPFLSPAPHRGKPNEPARVVDIAKFLSELRREPVTAMARHTSQNAETLFSKLTS